jgi:hypothetical protein
MVEPAWALADSAARTVIARRLFVNMILAPSFSEAHPLRFY